MDLNSSMETGDKSPDTIPKSEKQRGRVRYLKVILPIVIILIGWGAASYLKTTAVKSQKRPPVKIIPIVKTEPLSRGSHQVVVAAMGTVEPERQVVLRARVSGQVIDIHPDFSQGGIIRAGTRVLKIDPTDHELAIRQKMRQVAEAEYAIRLEEGRQEVARKEWHLLYGEKGALAPDSELALRKPHLEKARADLAAARAELEKARLDLSRTEVFVPFNAMVRTKNVDLGSQVTPQDALAELVGIDSYWVKATVPVDRLKWIDIPGTTANQGSPATITHAQGVETEGKVVRLLGDLAPEGRMARVLVQVHDPLGIHRIRDNRPPLLLGEYVKVHIQGQHLRDVFSIPRNAIRDHDFVWIADEQDRLQIRRVEPVWRGELTVLVKNDLMPGHRLIVSQLAAPVEGMPLRVEPMAQADSETASKQTPETPEKPEENQKGDESLK